MKILSTISLVLVSFTVLLGTLEASESSLPVDLAVRHSVGSTTRYVAHFSNTSPSPVTVQVEFFRAKGDHHKTFNLTIEANGWKEIGRNQGWNVLSGDQITVTGSGHETKHFHVP